MKSNAFCTKSNQKRKEVENERKINLSSCRRKTRLAVKPGRDELFMGDRLNLSILFVRRNRRFFVDEFFRQDRTRLEFNAQDGELD